MPLVLVGLALVVILGMLAAAWLTWNLVGLALQLFIAGLVGALADAVVPGKLPWGWLGAVAAGLIGSWLGVLLIGSIGPRLFGVPLLPSFVGAVILAFAAAAFSRQQLKRS